MAYSLCCPPQEAVSDLGAGCPRCAFVALALEVFDTSYSSHIAIEVGPLLRPAAICLLLIMRTLPLCDSVPYARYFLAHITCMMHASCK